MQRNLFYSENEFIIDLIMSSYKTTDLDLIIDKAKSDLDTSLSRAQVHDYLLNVDGVEVTSNSISMKEIFNMEVYE